jgi:hypothetical protein
LKSLFFKKSLNGSVYESLAGSTVNSSAGGYYPPETNNMMNRTNSFIAPDEDDNENAKGQY